MTDHCNRCWGIKDVDNDGHCDECQEIVAGGE